VTLLTGNFASLPKWWRKVRGGSFTPGLADRAQHFLRPQLEGIELQRECRQRQLQPFQFPGTRVVPGIDDA